MGLAELDREHDGGRVSAADTYPSEFLLPSKAKTN